MILTVKDLAERWACSRFHIYDLCKNKRIPYFSIGLTDHKGYRFRLSDIEKYECTSSQSTEENTASTGGIQSPDNLFDAALVRMTTTSPEAASKALNNWLTPGSKADTN